MNYAASAPKIRSISAFFNSPDYGELSQAGQRLTGAIRDLSLAAEAAGAASGISAAGNARYQELVNQGASAYNSGVFTGQLLDQGSQLLTSFIPKPGAGGEVGDFSVSDAEVMGMPTGQAEYMGGGGDVYWDTDMGQNSWAKAKPNFFGPN